MTSFQDQRILVVGGAGFVGSNLVTALLQDAPKKILVVDNLLSSERENVHYHHLVTFIQGSITDDRILENITDQWDYIFHLATYHGNQSSIYNPIADHENNTLTTLKLFDRVKGFSQLKRVVYASAGCTVAEKTFDHAHATTEDEAISLYLDSPYQISKIIGEFYSNYYFKRHNLPVVKARFQNVYGPREILGAGEWRGTPATIWRNVTPAFIYRALKDMPLLLENGGIATRDFIYVDDIVRGLMLCATKGENGEVYNLASGVETSVLELAKSIVKITNSQSILEIQEKRTWDNSGKRFGSTKKAKEKLSFSCQVDLSNGLNLTVRWTEKNIKLIENSIQKHNFLLNM